MDAVAALQFRGHFVANPDVGEGAAHHHFVVAAPGAVGIEVGHVHALLLQVLAGRAVRLDSPGRRNVVRGHGVSQQRQQPSVGDFHGLLQVAPDGEERRLLDVGGVQPAVSGAVLHFDGPPSLRPGEHVRVLAGKHCGGHFANRLRHLLVAGPYIPQMHGLAVRIRADGLPGQIDAGGSGQGVGHHQQRRSQPVGPHFLMHPSLEVAVAGQHRRHHQIAFGNGLGDRLRQRPGIADAGGAAVTHQVEPQSVQGLLQAGLGQVLGDHLGAGRQGGLDPRRHPQAALQSLLGQEAGAQHHRRIGGVGAGGDGGDDHRAMADLLGRTRYANAPLAGVRTALQFQGGVESRRHVRHRHPVLGTLGAGQAGRHRG